MRKPFNWSLVAVLGACSILLPALAFLQYRWLAQLSVDEHARMRRDLHDAAQQMANEFDTEIGRARVALQTGSPIYEQQLLPEYAARFKAWKASATHPRLIANFYVTSGKAGVAELWRMDSSSGAFSRTAWPLRFAPLRDRLALLSQEGLGDSLLTIGGLEDNWPLLVASQIPASATRQVYPAPASAAEAPAGWSILELDSSYIRSEEFPQLIRKHLARDGKLDYRVQIVTRAQPAEIIFDSSAGSGSGIISPPDVGVPIFVPRRSGSTRRVSAFGEDLTEQNVDPLAGEPYGQAQPARPPSSNALWTVLVRHRSGSLQSAAGALLRRNLAISFSVLLMLAASIGTLVLSVRRAQRLAQLQMEFVAGVSHELRTPLSVIRLAGQNLADGVSAAGEQAKRYGELIRNEERRLSEIVEQVLAYSRAGLGGLQFERRPVEVAELIERAMSASAADVCENGCSVVPEVEEGLPPILGDATALSQCLRNLVSNAARHGGRGGEIRIRAARVADGVQIGVQDNGAGIEPVDIPHLFEPFYRGQRARAEQVRGMGLGLALVKRIVNAHGGTITVDSRQGKGTSFRVHLPIAKAARMANGA